MMYFQPVLYATVPGGKGISVPRYRSDHKSKNKQKSHRLFGQRKEEANVQAQRERILAPVSRLALDVPKAVECQSLLAKLLQCISQKFLTPTVYSKAESHTVSFSSSHRSVACHKKSAGHHKSELTTKHIREGNTNPKRWGKYWRKWVLSVVQALNSPT